MAEISAFQTTEGLKEFIFNKSEEELKKQLPELTVVEISRIFLILRSQFIPDSTRKAEIIFEYIYKNNLLENFGRILTVPSYLAVMDFLILYPTYQKSLSAILVGLQPHVFFQSIYFCDEDQLTLLKHESLFAPLQYQLTQFVHEGNKRLNLIDQKIEKLKIDFLHIQHEELDEKELQLCEEKILALKEEILEYLDCIKKVLIVAWHTDRLDLIDKISILNEAFHHQLNDQIGHPSVDEISSTGLFEFLEKILSSIFENSFLSEQDASSEGLTRLGVWYLADYWKLGILPYIEKIEDLEDKQQDEKNRWLHHQKLFSDVHYQLKLLGLETVGDLKKNNIYSKQLLIDFIKKNKNKITV